MNSESWGFIGALAGAIIGASASIFTSRINTKNAILLLENSENNSRKERYREFQRNNLIELQDKLSLIMRLIYRAFLEDLNNYKITNSWRSKLISHDLDEEISNCFRDLSIKTERVDNDELRTEVKKLTRMMADLLLEKNYEKVEENQFKLTDIFQNVMPKIGKILRENY